MHVIIFMSLTFWGLIVDPSCVFYTHRAVYLYDIAVLGLPLKARSDGIDVVNSL